MSNQRKLGVVLSYTAQLIQIVINLVYTPIMLRLVGQSEYGLYQMVYSVVSSLSILNFGFNTAYVRYYSRYKAENDIQGISSLNGMFLATFSVIALLAAAVGGVFVSNIDIVLGEKLTISELATARVLMVLLVVNLVLTFPSSVFDCYITAQERFIFQKLVLICQYVLNPVVTLPLLMLGYGSIAMVAVTTVFTIARMLISIMFCFRKLGMTISLQGFRFSLLREMFVFTFFVFIGHIIDQINWNVDKFLLGRYVGTASVAVYGLASTINNMYTSFSSSISAVFVPKVNQMVARKEDDWQLTLLFTRVGRIKFYVLMLIVIGFVSVGQPFMCLWGGAEYVESYYVAMILMIPSVIPLAQSVGIEIQRAKNMHQIRSVVYLVIAIGNVVLSIPLIHRFGEIGAALGTAIALVLGNILFMNWYYHKRIGLDMAYFWKELLSILPSLLPPAAAGLLIIRYAQITDWPSLAGYGAVVAGVYLVSVFFIGFNPYEKEMVYAVFRKLPIFKKM